MPTVIVAPWNALPNPDLGGHFWVFIQYIQGLRSIGCDVYWLEPNRLNDHGADIDRVLRYRRRLQPFDLQDKLILYRRRGGEVTFSTTAPESADRILVALEDVPGLRDL